MSDAISLADFFEDHRATKSSTQTTKQSNGNNDVQKTVDGDVRHDNDVETQKVVELITKMEKTLQMSVSLAKKHLCVDPVVDTTINTTTNLQSNRSFRCNNGEAEDSTSQTDKENKKKKSDVKSERQFMKSFDSVSERKQALEFMNQFGFVCLHNVVDSEQCASLEDKCYEWLEGLGSGLKRGDWSTFTNAHMPDNYTTGLLDGVAPPDPKAITVPKEQLLYEKMLSLSKMSSKLRGDAASAPVEDFMMESSEGSGIRESILQEIDSAPITPVRLLAGKVSSAVPHKRKHKDMYAMVQGDKLESSKYISSKPVYYVARESPNTAEVQPKKKRNLGKTNNNTKSSVPVSTMQSRTTSSTAVMEDELSVELGTVRDMRYRFDPLTHCQEAWDIRTSPKIYAFFRTLWNCEDDLLASVDRLLFQRPLLSRPRNTAENWSNFEQRPTWEHNPYWSSNPVLQHSVEQQRCARHNEPIGDGSHMLLQKRKRVRKSSKQKTNSESHAPQQTSFFSGYQSVLALRDMPADGGAFYLVPAFHKVYAAYASAHATEMAKTACGVVRAEVSDPLARKLIFANAMQIPLRQGTLLVFDKRVPRWGSDNRRADQPTIAMFLNMWPREKAFDAAYRRIRALSVRYGIRCTALQHLTGHIATPPRWKRAVPRSVYENYSAPLFTELGLCLTGVRRYTKEIVENAIKMQ